MPNTKPGKSAIHTKTRFNTMNNGRQKTLNKCKEMVDLRIYFKVAVMLAMLLLFLLEVRLVSATKKSTNIWRKNFS